MGIKSAIGRSLLEWREDKGKGRGVARQGRCADGRVSKRGKQERGHWYGDESEDREPVGCREKGAAHST